MFSDIIGNLSGQNQGKKKYANKAIVELMKTDVQKIDKGAAAIFKELKNATRKTNSFASHDTIWQRKDKAIKSVMKLPLSEEMESKISSKNSVVKGHAIAVHEKVKVVKKKIEIHQIRTEKKKEKLERSIAEMKDYVEKGGIDF